MASPAKQMVEVSFEGKLPAYGKEVPSEKLSYSFLRSALTAHVGPLGFTVLQLLRPSRKNDNQTFEVDEDSPPPVSDGSLTLYVKLGEKPATSGSLPQSGGQVNNISVAAPVINVGAPVIGAPVVNVAAPVVNVSVVAGQQTPL